MWHPISSVLIENPPCLATRELVRMLLGGGELDLVYAGDRMWPAVAHGRRIRVSAAGDEPLRPGSVVLAAVSGIPDLLRVEALAGDRVRLAADADPGAPVEIAREEILARTELPLRRVGALGRARRRLTLELREAGHDERSTEDPALSVQRKYEYQAPFYSRAPGADLEPGLLARVEAGVVRGGRILVVGSGAGRECFALAAAGWQVHGIDFSPAMVEHATREAQRRGLNVAFDVGDIRGHREPPGSLSAVLFTYDVYSFIPAADRVAVLELMRTWLAPRGVVFLSARRVHSLYERCILTLQWWAHRSHGKRPWGESHTRWVGGDGTLRRSFVHVFGRRRLRREIRDAGFRCAPWIAGHAALRPSR